MRIALIAGYCLVTLVAFAHGDYPAECCMAVRCYGAGTGADLSPRISW
jgi:hypothetical protein